MRHTGCLHCFVLFCCFALFWGFCRLLWTDQLVPRTTAMRHEEYDVLAPGPGAPTSPLRRHHNVVGSWWSQHASSVYRALLVGFLVVAQSVSMVYFKKVRARALWLAACEPCRAGQHGSLLD